MQTTMKLNGWNNDSLVKIAMLLYWFRKIRSSVMGVELKTWSRTHEHKQSFHNILVEFEENLLGTSPTAVDLCEQRICAPTPHRRAVWPTREAIKIIFEI